MECWMRWALVTLAAMLIALTPDPTSAEPIAPAWLEEPAAVEAPPRIVAIGDLHGDHEAFLAIAEHAGLISSEGSWIGGNTVLVQTGDVPDRGPDSLGIIRDLMRLQDEAAMVGGQVVALIGNHEVMNVIGDLRYVHDGEYAMFRNDSSERVRRRYYRANQSQIERFYRARQPALSEDQIRRLWLRDTPLGGAELMMAWGPEGEIGQWLADNPAVILIGDTLFAHAGISDAYTNLSIEEINRQVVVAITERDSAMDSIINDPEGPLWYRGYFLRGERGEVAILPPEEAEPEVDRVLAAYDARRIVVGHTTALGGIRILLGGRLIGIDTGISAHYGGPRSYLEIRGDTVVAHIIEEEGNP